MFREAALTFGLIVLLNIASAQVQRVWLPDRSREPDRVAVNWQTARPGESVVQYGPTAELGHGRTVDENVTLHHVEIPIRIRRSWPVRTTTSCSRSGGDRAR